MRESAWAYFIVGSAVLVAAEACWRNRHRRRASSRIAIGFRRCRALGGKWWSPPDRVPFRLYAIGALLFSTGTIVREVLSGFDVVNSPNVADLIDASGYIAMILATLRLVQKRTKGLDPTNLLDSLVAVGGVAVPMWIFVILPFTRHGGIPIGDRSVELVFTIESLVLFGAFCRVAIGPGARNISTTCSRSVVAPRGIGSERRCRPRGRLSFVANPSSRVFGAGGSRSWARAALNTQYANSRAATEPVVHITHARFALCSAVPRHATDSDGRRSPNMTSDARRGCRDSAG